MARQWIAQEPVRGPHDLTLSDAVNSYIDLKQSSLSPTTVRAYRSIYLNHVDGTVLGDMRVQDITSLDLQTYISQYAARKTPAKTVRNIYGLISAAIAVYRPGAAFSVTLPQTSKPDLYTPTESEVLAFLDSIRTDRELYLMSLICAFGPCRRSEACGVAFSDIDGNTIHIHTVRIQDEDGAWIYKDHPKTPASDRRILYPESVIHEIGKGFGYVIKNSTPDALSERFARAVSRAGLPHFRMHDLRHFGASILHAIGVPDQYIMARGGWSSPSVMQRIYRNALQDVDQEMQKKAAGHFEDQLTRKHG